MKKFRSRRTAASIIATTALAAMFTGISVTPAMAADTATDHASPAIAYPGSVAFAPAEVELLGGGLLGGLLGGVVTPVLNSLVNPLLAGVANLPSTIVNPLLVSVVGGNHNAETPGPTIDPAENTLTTGTPVTCAAGSTTCYQQGGLGINVPGVITFGTTLVQGTTQRVFVTGGDKLVAKSQIAGVSIGGLLGLVNVVQTGVVQSTSQCSGTLSTVPTSSTASTASVGLLGTYNGQPVVGVDVSNNAGVAAINVKVLGATLPVGGSLPINIPGLKANVVLNGSLLNVAVELGLSDILSGLGLGAVGALIGNLAGLEATLNVGVGSEVVTTATSTYASGLSLRLGLGLDVLLNVPGVAKIGIKTSGDTTKNIVDLKLAYTNCSKSGGSVTPSTWILPGLT